MNIGLDFFFCRELLQPVEIKIQAGEVNLERSHAL